MRWRANPSPISLNTGVRVLNPAYLFIPQGEIQEVSIGMMISTFICLLLALITAHFPANVCGDGEEDLEEGNSHFGYCWEGGRALHIANPLTLPFYLSRYHSVTLIHNILYKHYPCSNPREPEMLHLILFRLLSKHKGNGR